MDAPQNAAGRVQSLIDRLEITPYQFAKETGLSHQTISNLLTGKNKPSLDTLEAIASRYPGEASWLLTGKSEPVGRTLAPRPVAAAVAGPTSGAATVEYATWLVAKDAMRETIVLQAERIADLRSTVEFLKVELGKSPGSPGATAAPANPTGPLPNPKLRVERQRGQAEGAIGFKQGRR